MNYKFLTLLLSSVSLIRALQAAENFDDDEIDLNAAIAASLKEHRAGEERPAPNVQLHNAPHMPLRQHVGPIIQNGVVPEEEDPEMAAVMAASMREFEEKQRQEPQGDAEAKAIAQSKIDHAIKLFSQRRGEIDALHQKFHLAKAGEMDERKRDDFRTKLKLIYLQNFLPEEEDAFREIEIIDQSFYEALDSDIFKTMEEFEKSFKEYLANRLQVRLACANGNPQLGVLIRADEAQEAILIRSDVKEDVEKIRAREEAAKKEAAEELAKTQKARSSYHEAVCGALSEFLKDKRDGNFEAFKTFLATKKLTITDYEDIVLDSWGLKEGILFSIQAQEVAAKEEAQRKARELQENKEAFLARIEKQQAALKITHEEDKAKKLAEAKRAEAVALAQKEALEQAAKLKSSQSSDAKKLTPLTSGDAQSEAAAKKAELDRERRVQREAWLARIDKEREEAKKKALEEERLKKVAIEEAKKRELEKEQIRKRAAEEARKKEAEALAEREKIMQAARLKFSQDFEAKKAELEKEKEAQSKPPEEDSLMRAARLKFARDFEAKKAELLQASGNKEDKK